MFFITANKAVEVNEMWRVRQKELELDDRLRGKSRDGNNTSRSQGSFRPSTDSSHDIPSSSSPSNRRVSEDCHLREDQGLKDEELEEFLHSRYLCVYACVLLGNTRLFVPWLDTSINMQLQ